MAVFDVTSFEAKAEVLGKLRKVVFDGSSLCIHDLTLEDAKLVLGRAAAGLKAQLFEGDVQYAYTDAPGGPTSSPEPKSEPPAEGDVTVDAGTPARTVASSPEPREETKPAAKSRKRKPKKAEAPVPDQEAPSGNGGTDPAEAASAEGGEADVVDLKEKRQASDVVGRAAKCTRLGDIVRFMLKDQIYSDEEALIQACLEMKAQVPIMAKIVNLEDRLRRAIEIARGA